MQLFVALLPSVGFWLDFVGVFNPVGDIVQVLNALKRIFCGYDLPATDNGRYNQLKQQHFLNLFRSNACHHIREQGAVGRLLKN